MRYIKMSTKYKYVSKVERSKNIYWRGTGVRGTATREYKTEREAAIAVDKLLIQMGKEPVNILIRK